MLLCLCLRCCPEEEEQWIRRMSERQSAPDQLAAGKSQGGAGATYKVAQDPSSTFLVLVSDAGASENMRPDAITVANVPG